MGCTTLIIARRGERAALGGTMDNRHREFGVALADFYSDKLLNEAYDRQLETFFATGLNADDDPRLEASLSLYSTAWRAQYGLIPYEPADWTECILTFTEGTQN